MCLYPVRIRTHSKNGLSQSVTVACGSCLECLRQKSMEWAFRITDECSQYSENCFITLTYNNEFCPRTGVSRREVQLFVKRLRKALYPRRIRFFACGEYGKRFSRPHYHIIVFNWYPSDAWFFQRDSSGVELFRSPLVESVWSKGFSSVGKVTFDTALYCAKYMNKYMFDNRKLTDIYNPPFVQMSNRPGIGFDCVYCADLVSDRIYRNGRSIKIPRYYLKVMERDGVFLDGFKERRQAQGEQVSALVNLYEKRKMYFDRYLKK